MGSVRPIYFDHAATTPCDPGVLEAMLPWFSERFGNPSSRSHAWGWEAEEAVEVARRHVAALIGAAPEEVVFTSGATEADNLALRGVLEGPGREGARLLASSIEHSAVLDTARALADDGRPVEFLPVDASGRLDPAVLAKQLEAKTALVSVMHGNNEIGVLQDLPKLSAAAHAAGALFHSDAAQSFGKVAIDVNAMGVDLLSMSGHKVYGPKGVGALFVRRRSPRVRLRPEQTGGGQERGLRSGTSNVPAIVGFGEAARLAALRMQSDAIQVASLRDRFEEKVVARVPGIRWHGAQAARLPGISNLRVEGIEGEALLLALRGVALSSGSACASATLEPSHVLLALGCDEEEARSSLRVSLGRTNTEAEVDQVVDWLAVAVADIRSARAPQVGRTVERDSV